MTAVAIAAVRASAARRATWTFFTLNGFAIGIWVVHIPVIGEATGISHSTLGALLMLLGGSAFIGMQVGGALADKLGQRKLLPAAGVLMGFALFGPGLADSWWTLAPTLVLFGFSNGMIDVCMNAHAVIVERAYSRPIMAAFHAMWSVGGAAAAAVGAVVLAAGVPAFVTLATCGALIGFISLGCARFLLETEMKENDEAYEKSARRESAPAGLVWCLGCLAFVFMLGEGVAADWAALHFKDTLGTTTSTAAYAYGAFAIAMTAGRFLTDRAAAAFGPVAIVRYGAALAAIGLAIVIVSPWVPVSLVGWALFGLGLSGGVPQLFTAAGNLDAQSAGTLMARVVGLGYVGILAGPAIIGGLTHWVPLHAAFVLPVLLCVLASMFATVLRPTPRNGRNRRPNGSSCRCDPSPTSSDVPT